MDFTIINYYGKQTSKCGYCKGRECSIAHGMHAYDMSTQDYQDLIDRGWRRSGHYCYKPHNKFTCCPCYTIKCNALDFKLSKSNKKVLKRMNRFLRDGKKDKLDEEDGSARKTNAGGEDDDGHVAGGIQDEPQAPNVPIKEIDLAAITAANAATHEWHPKEKRSASIPPQKMSATPMQEATSGVSKKSFDGLTKPPCKKAKQMRIERRQAKLAAKGMTTEPIPNATGSTGAEKVNAGTREKSLADFIAETTPEDKHKLKLEIVHVKSKQFANTLGSTYALYQKYQTRIHNDPPDNVKEYLNFLQRSPLKHSKPQNGPSFGYGSFHQQYWLDDKLIAVGVIDILPNCVSSVYFFYDPDYSFLSLGTYGSLREIEFVQQLAAKVPSLKYYYMGFYIHSCPKMRYKGKLVPSYLLCPETYTWILLTDEIRAKLDASKYQRLNADATVRDVDEFLDSHLDLVLLLVENNSFMTYRQYIQITGEDDDRGFVKEYGKLVGKTLAHRMLYLKI